jgi:hypothetical protein
MPLFPIANAQAQQFLDSSHWIWPEADSVYWKNVDTVGPTAQTVVATGAYTRYLVLDDAG